MKVRVTSLLSSREQTEDNGAKKGEFVAIPAKGYWIEGDLIRMEAGVSLVVNRSVRNGIEAPGIFRTSDVKKVEATGRNSWEVNTENSTYLVEALDEGYD